jgi:hypothetical protein
MIHVKIFLLRIRTINKKTALHNGDALPTKGHVNYKYVINFHLKLQDKQLVAITWHYLSRSNEPTSRSIKINDDFLRSDIGLFCSILVSNNVGDQLDAARAAPSTLNTQSAPRLSGPPPGNNLGAENHKL